MIIWLVDVPWPLLPYGLSFGIAPCLAAPEGRGRDNVSFQLVSPFRPFFLVAVVKNVLWEGEIDCG